MKNLLLLGVSTILSFGANAQSAKAPFIAPSAVKQQIQPNAQMSVVSATGLSQGQNKTAATTTRWYNHAEALGSAYAVQDMYDEDHFGVYYMWPDSTVRFPSPSNGFGITYLTIGQMFHPQASTFTDQTVAYNTGKQVITAANAYNIDSVMVRGFYNRLPNSTTVDTLVFTMVTGTPSYDFAQFWYGAATAANHGQDTFYAMLWSSADFANRPINQISYGSGSTRLSTAVVYKMPLNAAVFADSTTDGYHMLKAPMNVSVPAGQKAAVSITYKPGSSYTSGTEITNYNYFLFGSHKVSPGAFTFYPPKDYNMSSIVDKDTTGNAVNSTLSIYTPTIAYSSPAFPAELHSISFKVTCTSCSTQAVNNTYANVTVAANPNPAVNEFNVPVTLTNAADVKVVLTNPVGQVVATQQLGKVAAGQTATATFNTAGLSNGIYFYTVEAGTERITNRVVVAH